MAITRIEKRKGSFALERLKSALLTTLTVSDSSGLKEGCLIIWRPRLLWKFLIKFSVCERPEAKSARNHSISGECQEYVSTVLVGNTLFAARRHGTTSLPSIHDRTGCSSVIFSNVYGAVHMCNACICIQWISLPQGICRKKTPHGPFWAHRPKVQYFVSCFFLLPSWLFEKLDASWNRRRDLEKSLVVPPTRDKILMFSLPAQVPHVQLALGRKGRKSPKSKRLRAERVFRQSATMSDHGCVPLRIYS